MNGKRIEIFKLFGFPIRVDATWLIILLFVTYSLAGGFFPANHPGLPATAYWSMGFVAAMGLFASILFHELAHSLVARHYRMKIDGITLFIFGGVAEMREEAPSPKVEFLMAIVGPLASALLAAGFFWLYSLTVASSLNRGLVLIFYYLGFMNALLAGFNLLPAFPLDGGRVFRAILWAAKKDHRWATRIAGKVGQGFGWLMIAWGIFKITQRDVFGGGWAILIGFFLKKASQLSIRQVDLKNLLERSSVAPALQSDFVALHPQDRLFSLAPLLEGHNLYSHFPVLEAENLVGYLPLNKLQNLSGETWERLRVSDLMEPDFERLVLDAQNNAFDAFEKMRQEQASNLFVLDGGRMSGVVTAHGLMHLVQGSLGGKSRG
jgi:Zn-dependent proteases